MAGRVSDIGLLGVTAGGSWRRETISRQRHGLLPTHFRVSPQVFVPHLLYQLSRGVGMVRGVALAVCGDRSRARLQYE